MSRSSLVDWIQHALEANQVSVKVRLRGNNLYILCESRPCPDAMAIAHQLQRTLQPTALAAHLPAGAAEIHRVICYGRTLGAKDPAWAKAFLPQATTRQPSPSVTAQTTAPPTADSTPQSAASQAESPDIREPLAASAELNSQGSSASDAPGAEVTDPVRSQMVQLAQQGDPTAIAHYLSQTLSTLGIGIRAKLDSAPAATVPAVAGSSAATPSNSPLKRLLILCESSYTPDSSLLAEPIAQQLRQLGLTQFRDAVVFGQVSGEQRPEWLVRIDLTPRDEILREWARWGDVQAIAHLLNRQLGQQEIRLTALLKETTLHLSCTHTDQTAPTKTSALDIILPTLQTLTPQGIHTAIIYGIAAPSAPAQTSDTTADPIPGWIHLVELAATDSEQGIPTLERARQGEGRSLTFLLTRLLNPDLDATLATGGIRVQIRHKADLLHILTEAPTCPRQDAVVPAVVRCLKPLQIADVAGIRVYGRRAGQKQPLWHYGLDFSPRQPQRLVPEATPEFAASDAHVDELLPTPGAIVLWSELPADGLGALLGQLYAQTIEHVQRSLIRTQLFVPVDNVSLSASPVPLKPSAKMNRQHLKVAVLWGAIGGLLLLQMDWVLGAWVRVGSQQAQAPIDPIPTATTPAIAQPTPLPTMALSQKPQTNGFNKSPFTRPGDLSPASPVMGTAQPLDPSAPLPASPLQAKAASLLPTDSNHPSFNSHQFDDQIGLYRRYLEIHGTPDVLVVGSSRALRGIDPVALETTLAQQGYTNVKVFNFGINGATAQVVDLLVRQILPQDKLPKLILFADGARAFNSGRLDITYNGIVASTGYQALLAGNPPFPTTTLVAKASASQSQPQPTATKADRDASPPKTLYQQWNELLNQRLAALSMVYGQRDRLKAKLREQFTALLPKELTAATVIASSDNLIDTSPAASASGTNPAIVPNVADKVDINGFLPLSMQFNPVTYYQKYARVPGDYDSDYEGFNLQGAQTDAMISLSRYAQAHRIPLVFVNLPLTQEYLDPVRKEHEEAFEPFMLQLATQHGFFYRNLGSALLTQPHYFSDPNHLNRYGAYAVSQKLAQDVMIPWQVTK